MLHEAASSPTTAPDMSQILSRSRSRQRRRRMGGAAGLSLLLFLPAAALYSRLVVDTSRPEQVVTGTRSPKGGEHTRVVGSALASATPIRDAQLVASSTGWSLTSSELRWTQDNGGNWSTITPPGVSGATILTAFFLDVKSGWAVTDTPANSNSTAGHFRVYRTGDAGQTWSSSDLGDLDLPYQRPGPASISFPDSSNGWVLIDRGSHGVSEYSSLFRTDDGGAT